jgi:hypothetical protein
MADCRITNESYDSICRLKGEIIRKILRDGSTSYLKLDSRYKWYFYSAVGRLVEEGLICGDDNWLAIREGKMVEAMLQYG